MLGSIIPSLDPRDWYTALDLRDTYFHMLIYQWHRKFLRGGVQHLPYQFMVLPAAAPQVFTKYMAMVAAFLRTLGV